MFIPILTIISALFSVSVVSILGINRSQHDSTLASLCSLGPRLPGADDSDGELDGFAMVSCVVQSEHGSRVRLPDADDSDGEVTFDARRIRQSREAVVLTEDDWKAARAARESDSKGISA